MILCPNCDCVIDEEEFDYNFLDDAHEKCPCCHSDIIVSRHYEYDIVLDEGNETYMKYAPESGGYNDAMFGASDDWEPE